MIPGLVVKHWSRGRSGWVWIGRFRFRIGFGFRIVRIQDKGLEIVDDC